jgi:menaquinone-9 beta-reductase
MANKVYDSIVVGAGPAGSAVAALLARAGFSVLLLDRAAFPREKPCGEYTSPETERVLARIGALPAVEQAGARRFRSMHLISPAGRRFSLDYSSPEDIAGRQVLATPRLALDAALVDHARRSGVEVRERAKVEAVTMRDGRAAGVIVRSLPSGQAGSKSMKVESLEASEPSNLQTFNPSNPISGPEEIQARLVIGADGVHSAVVRSLGLEAPLRWPRNLGLIAHYRGHNGLEEWGEMHVSPRGYVGLAPQSGGMLNVGAVMPMGRARELTGSAAARFEDFAHSFSGVAARLRGAERVSSVRGVGPIGARVRRTSGPGYLLVGDAAGFFDPFTGEGVYKALRGAELAFEVASDALERNDLSAQSLARYSKLRRREFTAKDLVCRMVQLFVVLPPAMDYVAGRLAARPGVREIMTGVLGDYADARSALSPKYLWSLLRP